jgi:hypothetical protein
MGRKPIKKAVVIDDAPSVPEELDYLWRWFNEILMGIAPSGLAPATVTWEALAAWSAITQEILEPWEASTLVVLGQMHAALSIKPKTKPGKANG